MLIALSATLAGAEGFSDLAERAQTKEGWLRTFLELPGGIPSHDTFRRVALSLAKRDTPSRSSVRLRLKRAGWDDAYLFNLLNI